MDNILMNVLYIFGFFKSIFMFYLYMIQTTCVLSLDGGVRSGQEGVPCDCTDNISMNFMDIFVWILIFFIYT